MDARQLADRLVSWIRDKVLAAGGRGVVIGMSGGLDSSVLAVLCHRAFPQSMLGVIIPCLRLYPMRRQRLRSADWPRVTSKPD